MKIKDFMEKEGYSFYTDDAGGFHVEKRGKKDIKSNDVIPDILESIGNTIKELLCEYEYAELDVVLRGKNED